MSIQNCKVCGKLISRSSMIMKVYPPDYDFNACNDCNAAASNED
jgi:hypothetical protein